MFPDRAAGHGPINFRLTEVVVHEGGYELAWNHVGEGWVYAVQSRDAVGEDGLWLPPADEPWPIVSRRWLDARPTGRVRFYRVEAVRAAERGKVLSVSAPTTYTRTTIGLILALAAIPITPEYDVRSYTVVYETITPSGGRTLASGSLLLPVGAGRPVPLTSYQHGTVPRTNDSPGQEVYVGVAFATTGYAAVVPNYLGLGQISAGLQPFLHARSEATACVDMLRAARRVCATNGQALNGQLFLAGYSHGGHATMALLRELELFHTNEFPVTACASSSGAYDLSGVTAADVLSERPPPNPYHFALLLAAYQSVYQLAPSLGELLVSPYDATLPPLVGGGTSADQLNAALPAVPVHILKPQYLAAFLANPNHPLRLALQANDVHRWRPRAPLHLYHCSGDLDVLPANSEAARASFFSLGATQVELTDPEPTADHAGCIFPSLIDAKAWFDSLIVPP